MKYISYLDALMIAENVKNIRERISFACGRAGRKSDEVTLVAVAKTFSQAAIREVLEAGVWDIGENYVQELRRKRDELNCDARWHFIGHLQSNKVKYIAGWIHYIHAVDSLSLGREISTWGERKGRKIGILVEVNTTGEKSKYGVTPDSAPRLAKELSMLPGLYTRGLMTMAPFSSDPEGSRQSFRMLRDLRDEIQKQGLEIPHLSMGMTGDYEVAIEEGATIVRIGRAIFGIRSTHERED